MQQRANRNQTLCCCGEDTASVHGARALLYQRSYWKILIFLKKLKNEYLTEQFHRYVKYIYVLCCRCTEVNMLTI